MRAGFWRSLAIFFQAFEAFRAYRDYIQYQNSLKLSGIEERSHLENLKSAPDNTVPKRLRYANAKNVCISYMRNK